MFVIGSLRFSTLWLVLIRILSRYRHLHYHLHLHPFFISFSLFSPLLFLLIQVDLVIPWFFGRSSFCAPFFSPDGLYWSVQIFLRRYVIGFCVNTFQNENVRLIFRIGSIIFLVKRYRNKWMVVIVEFLLACLLKPFLEIIRSTSPSRICHFGGNVS